MNKISLARDLAKHFHGTQQYGDKPYVHHLAMVADYCEGYVKQYGDDIIVVAYLHDILEDTPCCTETLANIFGPNVATAVSNLTDISAPNRKERKRLTNEKLKNLLRDKVNDMSLIVKASDRLANVKCSIDGRSTHVQMYAREQEDFYAAVCRPGLNEPLLDQINKLFAT